MHFFEFIDYFECVKDLSWELKGRKSQPKEILKLSMMQRYQGLDPVYELSSAGILDSLCSAT